MVEEYRKRTAAATVEPVKLSADSSNPGLCECTEAGFGPAFGKEPAITRPLSRFAPERSFMNIKDFDYMSIFVMYS